MKEGITHEEMCSVQQNLLTNSPPTETDQLQLIYLTKKTVCDDTGAYSFIVSGCVSSLYAKPSKAPAGPCLT